MRANETVVRLLNAAQLLIQERGYNAFSYKDLAEKVGIRTASIHYHFAAKADLGLALMERYVEELDRTLASIDRTRSTNKAKLKSFIKLYRDTESCGAICLCGSLASDRETLSPPLQEAVAAYIERSETWIAERISAGIQQGEFSFAGKPADVAATLMSSLQGGLILSRSRSGRPLLATIQRVFFSALEAA
ncbi:MAG: TetR/AcrR family transcriptional regulator [Proteobacteria bacterium]|nr:TetR/AcrR family transcriptional regulator [Pseudomonadota bacterium]